MIENNEFISVLTDLDSILRSKSSSISIVNNRCSYLIDLIDSLRFKSSIQSNTQLRHTEIDQTNVNIEVCSSKEEQCIVDDLDGILNQAKLLRQSKPSHKNLKTFSAKLSVASSNHSPRGSSSSSKKSTSHISQLTASSIMLQSIVSPSRASFSSTKRADSSINSNTTAGITRATAKSNASVDVCKRPAKNLSDNDFSAQPKSSTSKSTASSRIVGSNDKLGSQSQLMRQSERQDELQKDIIAQRVSKLQHQLHKLHQKHTIVHCSNSRHPASADSTTLIKQSYELCVPSLFRSGISADSSDRGHKNIAPNPINISGIVSDPSPLFLSLVFHQCAVSGVSAGLNTIRDGKDKLRLISQLRHLKLLLVNQHAAYQKAFAQWFYGKDRASFAEHEHALLRDHWLRYQHLLMIFNQLKHEVAESASISTSNDGCRIQSSNDKQRSSDVVPSLKQLDCLPCMVPFSFHAEITHNTSFFAQKSSAPLSSRNMLFRRLELRWANHHKHIQTMVEYTVEAAVGSRYLAAVISLLRQCCQDSLRQNGSVSESLNNDGVVESTKTSIKLDEEVIARWQYALSLYRSVYNCLVFRGQNTSCCFFFEK